MYETDKDLLEAVIRGMVRAMNDEIIDKHERKFTYEEVTSDGRHGFTAMAKEAIKITREYNA